MAKTYQTNKKAIRLSLAILAGLILGALFGLVMPAWAEPVTSFISTVYLHSFDAVPGICREHPAA